MRERESVCVCEREMREREEAGEIKSIKNRENKTE